MFKSNEDESDCRPKHQSTGTQYTAYIFCESKNFEITTFNMDKSVKDITREMCDSKLLVKLSGWS